MAGDWLKVEAATPDKPEVFQIAGDLGIDPDAALGKLMRVWFWFDQQTVDGNADVTLVALLDRVTGVTGFCKAMAKVGWMTIGEKYVSLPNFSRHNGQTSKDRALTAKRVAFHRQKCNAASVTPSVTPSVTSSLPEKRREEKKKNSMSEAPILEFPCAGKLKVWHLFQSKVEEWSEAYPGVDVMLECRKALQWVRDNPSRMKTSGGMPKFLNSWLARSQNQGGGARNQQPHGEEKVNYVN